MTPVVSVWSRPNGLPMANTFWPTCRSLDVPMRERAQAFGAAPSIFSTARSFSGAAPTSLASQVDVVGERDAGARLRALDDVEVGDDVARVVPDEAGAGAVRDLRQVEAEGVAAHGQRGDEHHRGRGAAGRGRRWRARRSLSWPGADGALAAAVAADRRGRQARSTRRRRRSRAARSHAIVRAAARDRQHVSGVLRGAMGLLRLHRSLRVLKAAGRADASGQVNSRSSSRSRRCTSPSSVARSRRDTPALPARRIATADRSRPGCRRGSSARRARCGARGRVRATTSRRRSDRVRCGADRSPARGTDAPARWRRRCPSRPRISTAPGTPSFSVTTLKQKCMP